MSKKPEDLEVGDCFIAKYGHGGKLFYCVSNNGEVVGMNRFGWLDDAVISKTVEELENDSYFVYVGERRSRIREILSLGGLLFPRYCKKKKGVSE